MKLTRNVAFAALAAVAVGCVTPPQRAIPLDSSVMTPASGNIGILMSKLPKVDTSLPGAGCLLCYAVAAGANSALTKHANTLPYEGIDKLKDRAADILRRHGANVTLIPDSVDLAKLPGATSNKTPDTAKKNFSSLREKFKVDHLLVIDIGGIGFLRTYSSYIPTSDPKAYISGAVYIVNLTTNAYEWYQPIDISMSAEGAWDEPPQFPGLTNAYFQVVESGKDAILKPLAK